MTVPHAPLQSGSTSVVTVCRPHIGTCDYPHVQDALDAVAPGTVIKVAAGVYTDTNGDFRVVAILKTVTIQGGYTVTNWSSSDPAAYPTILDGGNQAQVVYIGTGVSPVLSGFHIRSGSASRVGQTAGGGIYIASGGGAPIIEDNRIYNNTASTYGGGIYIAGGFPTIRRNRIYANIASNQGGGVYIAGSSPTLENNLIYSNSTPGQGGGIYISSGSALVRYNTLYGNAANVSGGGIFFRGSPIISSTIVVSNTAGSIGGIFRQDSTSLPQYNDVWGNVGGDYNFTAGLHDLQADPRLKNPSGADFQLEPDSPCIGKADPAYYPDEDFRVYARPFGYKPDIGAYEFYTGTCFARIAHGNVFSDVQTAVAESAPGALVRVAGICVGVKQIGGLSQTVRVDRALTLRGGYTLTNWSEPNRVTHRTILDGDGKGHVIYIAPGLPAVTIEGFDIRNGYAASNGGGGIFAQDIGSAIIRYNRIYSNSTAAGLPGGGIYLKGGNHRVENNEIYGNSTAGNGHGGGIAINTGTAGGSPTLLNNLIHDNIAGGEGGGFYSWVYSGYTLTVQHNRIYANTANKGGGASFGQAFSEFSDNDVYNNTAVMFGGGIFFYGGSTTIEGNRIYSNQVTAVDYDEGGGGLYIYSAAEGTQVTVRGNEVHSNSVAEQSGNKARGGGIHAIFKYPGTGEMILEGNRVYNNSSTFRGGGIYINLDTPYVATISVRNNLVYGNTADDDGGGIACWVRQAAGRVEIEHNTIYANGATNGGGIHQEELTPTLRNNAIISSTSGGAMAGVGATCDYCDLYGNVGGNSGGGTGAIYADPLFVDAGTGNFRLQSGSPCIGAAHPTAYAAYDFDGYARPFGARADIGAHEYYTGNCFARLMNSGRVYTTVQEAVVAAVGSGNPLPEVRVAGVCRESVVVTGPLTLLGGYAITQWTSPVSPTYLLAPAGGGRVLYITGPHTSTVTIGELIISGGNVSGNGGGIYIAAPLSPTIRNVVLYGNSATGNGGGLASVGGNPRLYNNTVVNNAAASGGGLYFAAGNPVVSNTIVVSNTGGGIRLVTGSATLAYNNVWHNTGYNYSGVTAGATDISEDPRFVNPAAGNFRLRPDSACVHSGDPHTALAWDFEGDARPLPSAGLYDIGADESTSYLGVDLGPAMLYDTAGPGEMVELAFVITNTGTLQDSYALTHTLVVSGGSSSGWIVSYTPVYTVAPAGRVQTPVYITIPLTAASGVQATLYLTAASRSNPAYFHDMAIGSLDVKREWGVEIGPAYSTDTNPGTVVVYVHTLTNTGNARDTFNLYLVSSLGLAQMNPTRVENLEVGKTAKVYVTVTVPAYAAGGAVERSVVTATSTSGPASASVEDITRINYVSGDRYVSTTGTDVLNNCRLTTRPCRSVGQALGQAASGDRILVAGGTYNEYNLTINKPVMLLGGYDATFTSRDPQARPTIIDANRQGRVLYIFGSATVDGFTLQNGYFNGPGGGVYAVNAPILRNNIIISNTAVGNRGGGVYNADGNLTLEWNILANNQADMGGGFYNYRGNPVVQYNTFQANYAVSRGGGIYNTGIAGAAPRVWTNVFYGNAAGTEGGGLYNLSGNSLVWHNTFYANVNDGIYVAGGAPVISNTIVVSNTGWGIRGTALTVDYNDVWANSSGNYGAGVSPGPNSISADPLFLDAPAGDFHLREGSPCIESGDHTNAAALKYDLDGQPRVMGNRPDMGADEFQRLGVAIQPTAAWQDGWPGQPLTYTHVLTNEGNYTDTFAITWSNQWPGWNVMVNGVVTQPLNIVLGQGATTTLYVRMTPTNLFSGTTNVTIITATSVIAQSDPETYLPVYATAADTTTVRRAWGVALEPDLYGWGSSAINERVVYTHVLTNTGNYTDSFTITWSNDQVPPGCLWPVNMDTPANTGPVGQGMTKTVQVSVYVPGCAGAGTGIYANTLVITATSNSDGSVKDLATDITVSNWQHGLQFAPSRSGTNWPGSKVYYTHVLTNTGNYTDTFVINYTSSRGWDVAVYPSVVTVGGWPTPRPAGAVYTATVYVTVTIPPLGVAFGGEVEQTVITATSRTDPTLKRAVVDTTTAKQVGGALFVYNYDDTPAPNNPAVRVYNPTGSSRPVVFTHTLTNLGNGPDIFDITVSSLKGWAVAISPAPTVSLGYRGSVTVFITLTTPGPGTPYPFPAPWDRVVATATSRFDPTTRDTVTDIAIVNQNPGVLLSPGYAQSAQPGWVTYTHILTNTGNYTDSFKLTYSGWEVVFSGDVNNVGPGMTRTVYARVSVPYQNCGTVGTSIITATSVYSPAVSAAILDVTTVAPVYAVALDTVRPVRALADSSTGGTAVYNHNVTNIGNCAGVFQFQGIQSDPHFTPTVTPASTTIPFGGQARITVTVAISPTDQVLAGTVVITASAPGGAGAAVTDTIVVNQVVDVYLEPDRTEVNHTGGAVAFTHILTNAGNYTDTFYLSWRNASGWDVSVQPQVVSLGPGASRPVTVVVTVRPNVYTTTNQTIVTATSDVLPWEQTRGYTPTAAVVDTLLVRRPHVVIEPVPGYAINMDPGTSTTLYHTLTNDGGLTGTYQVTSIRLLGWIDAVSLTVSNLPPGGSFPFTVPVVVPNGMWGLYDIAYITATEIYSGVFATARDVVTAPYRYDVTLLPSTRDTTVVPPAVVVYTHTLKNTGNYTTTYTLAADGEFSSASIVPASIYNLGPGETRLVTVTIAVPFEAAAGDVEDTRISISFADKRVYFYDTVHIGYAVGTRYVDRNGWDERNNCRTSTAPCATVQHAVDQASPGDEIRVAAGTYYDELLAGQVVRVDKSVKLSGGYDASDWESGPDPVLRQTVLNAASPPGRRVVVIGANVTPTIQGFHITGGYINGNGAGIYIDSGAAPTIRACYIYGNRAAGTGSLGGGIYYAGGGAPLFERNRIYENRASDGSGGGIYLAGGDSRLFNNIIYRNEAGTCGGGLCNASGTPLIYNNTFYSNTVSDQMGGGGLGSLAGTLVVSNTIVAKNAGTGIRVVGGTPPLLSYNDVWGNTPVNYECGSCTHPTDISSDPIFADAENDDFHLTSASPCVDAGDPRSVLPTNDHEDNPRPLPIGGRYDIGAYEYGLGGGKIADRPSADPSSRITYTIQVYNTTANPQTFPVTDTLHPYLSYVPGSLVATGGNVQYVTATRTISWLVTVPALSGESITFTVVVTDWAGSDVVITNVAWINLAPANTVSVSVNAVPNTRYVAPDGVDRDNGCNLPWRPCATVQRAVDQAVNGDTVLVASGTYSGAGVVATVSKSITLIGGYTRTGSYTATVWSYAPELYPTVLNGGLRINGPASVVVDGFRITGGSDGVYVAGSGGHLTLRRCWVYNNTGNGVRVENGTYTLINNVIARNGSGAGAGLRTTNSTGVLIHNTFGHNNNRAAVISGTAVFTNTIFSNHTVGLEIPAGSKATIEATLWWQNVMNQVSGQLIVGSINLTGDPAFVNPTGMDYHIGGNSEAIDRGIDAGVYTDIDRDLRPVLAGFDIGADEYPVGFTKVGPATAIAGQTITYVITMRAKDPNLVITDVLPVHLTFTPGTDVVTCTLGTCGYQPETNSIIWAGNTVTAGEVIITYTASLTNWLAAGTVITNGAVLNREGVLVDSEVWATQIVPVTGTRYVSKDGANRDAATGTYNNCLIYWKPCATIQYAVDQAQNGDTIKVASGVYTDVQTRAGATQNVYVNKSVTIRGGYTTTNWAVSDPELYPTVVDAGKAVRTLYATGPATITVAALELRNGRYIGSDGGGIYVTNATLTLVDALVHSHQVVGTGRRGGGIYAQNATLNLVNTQVYSNSSVNSNGGGIYCTGSTVKFAGVQIYSNTVSASNSDGGGVYCTGGSFEMSSGQVYGNSANGYGGGLYLENTVLAISNSRLHNNYSASGGGALYLRSSEVTLSHNRIYTNTATSSGGGLSLYLCPTATLDANWILDNSAGTQSFHMGGGVYIWGSGATVITMTNNVVAANRAGGGGDGIYAGGNSGANTGRFRHNTLADNDGEGLRVDAFGFSIEMVNTILAGQSVGIATKHTNAVVGADYTLWDGVGTKSDNSGGGIIFFSNDLIPNADPKFRNRGDLDYHLLLGSPAVDRGRNAGVDHDIDGDARPQGAGYDVGADELYVRVEAYKEVYPDPVEAGAQVTYTIYVTNVGSVDVNAVITDILPPQLTAYVPLTWTANISALGQVWTRQFTATVSWGYSGTLTNRVRVTTKEGASDEYVAISRARVTPALSLVKRAYPDPVEAGSVITYTIFVTNTSNTDLHLTITDTLPAQVTAAQPLVWTPVVAAPGGTWSTQFTATVSWSYSGTLTNTVRAVSAEGAEAVYKMTSQARVTPALVVTKQASTDLVKAGEQLTYTITVTNTGNTDLHLIITDTLPVFPGQGTVAIPVIWTPVVTAPGGVWVGTVVITVAPDYDGLIVNRVDVEALEGPQATAYVTTTVKGPASLSISKSVTPSSVQPGDLLTYTLRASNAGPGVATAPVIRDTVPSNTTYHSCSGGTGCQFSAGQVVWTLGSLPAGGQAVVTFTVRVNSGVPAGTNIVNQTYSITCTEGYSATGAPVSVPVGVVGGVEISAGQARTAFLGEVVTYTHRVTNTANIAQTLTIALTSSQGWATVTPTTIPSLAPLGGSAVVTVTVTIPATGVVSGTVERTTITVTGSSIGQAVATDITTAAIKGYYIYLPLVLRNF